MAEQSTEKLRIRLHVYDTDMPVNIRPQDEPLYRDAASLVFSVWAHGFDADGNILWDREPEFESQKTAIPRVLTDIQEDGNALQFDGAFKRYVKTEEFDEDKPNGYGRFKVFLLRRKLKKH